MTPEKLFDVFAFQTGASAPGQPPTVGLRFQLRDGTRLAFAIPAPMALDLAKDLLLKLKELDEQPPPASH